MDVAAMADAEAMVAGADVAGGGAVPDGNAHAVFYNTFCDVAFSVFCNGAHAVWEDAAALAGAAVHQS